MLQYEGDLGLLRFPKERLVDLYRCADQMEGALSGSLDRVLDEMDRSALHLDSLARERDFLSTASSGCASSSLMSRLRKAYSKFEVMRETREALAWIIEGSKSIEDPLLKRTFDFAAREGRELGLNDRSVLCFVGSGPFPESAMAYHALFKCRVDCIERDPVAASISQRLMRSCPGLDAIQVHVRDAQDMDYCAYSHVVVAVLTDPKECVATRVLEAGPHVRMALRNVRGSGSLVYEPLNRSWMKMYEDRFKILPEEGAIVHSLIFNGV